MKCNSNYCVYNRDFACVLDKISINSLGMCDDCITAESDENLLEAEKDAQGFSLGQILP